LPADVFFSVFQNENHLSVEKKDAHPEGEHYIVGGGSGDRDRVRYPEKLNFSEVHEFFFGFITNDIFTALPVCSEPSLDRLANGSAREIRWGCGEASVSS